MYNLGASYPPGMQIRSRNDVRRKSGLACVCHGVDRLSAGKRGSGMALRGNLHDFSVTQLLNLINLARKTGTLILDGPSDQAFVAFRNGKLAYPRIGVEDGGLATVLKQANKLNSNQFQALNARTASISDKELGLLLINAGYVSQEDILLDLQTHFAAVIRKLFTWVEGLFQFEPGIPPPEDRINVRMDLENLIIEGSRHLQEMEELQDEIPSLDLALKFTERPMTNLNLSVQEWRVVRFVDPRNSMKRIAAAAKLNEMEMRRIVYGLLQAGLVQLVRPVGAEVPRSPAMFPTKNPEEQRGLINRLIGRIQKL